MKLATAFSVFLFSSAPDFATASLRRTQAAQDADSEKNPPTPPPSSDHTTCEDACCRAIDNAASLLSSALQACGEVASAPSNSNHGWGVSSSGIGGGPESSAWGVAAESRRLKESSSTAAVSYYQPPDPSCLLFLCAAQTQGNALIAQACGHDPEGGLNYCKHVPGFTPPVARDDFASVIEGGSIVIKVLDNDSAVPGRSLIVTDVETSGVLGQCTIDFNNNQKVITYVSDGTVGNDVCVYETCYEDSPRLCDIAKVNIDIFGTPTEKPTSAPTDKPTPSPTQMCTIGLDIKCVNCGDKALATEVECTERPTQLILKYNGGNCDANKHGGQSKDTFSCSDENDGPPAAGEERVHIKVSDKNGHVYFSARRSIGDFVFLEAKDDGGKAYESDLYVTVSNADQTKVLQNVEFHASCSRPLYLLDKYGSVQIAEFVNEEDGRVSVKGNAKFSIEVSNSLSENVTVTELSLESTEPIVVSKLTDEEDFTLDAITGTKTFVEFLPLDLSVQHTYHYILNATGTGDNERECLGLLEKDFQIPE